MTRFYLISALLLFLPGCFHVKYFMQDFVLSSPGVDKGTSSVYYRYLGFTGPDQIILENGRGVRGTLDFDGFFYPDHDTWDRYNLEPAEGKALAERAKTTIRDYFGSRQEIELVVFKKIGLDFEADAYLIDAKIMGSLETLGERLVEAGLARVDHGLAKAAHVKTLIKLEDAARRGRRGIWKYAPILNPSWHD